MLTILNFYVAFQLWKVYRILIKTTRISTKIKQQINYIFKQVPVMIMDRQLQIYQVRKQYQELTWKFKKVQQSLQLINLGFYIWKRYLRTLNL